MTWTACKHGGPSPDVAALSEALTAAQKRIAELEDWQRRAVAPLEMLVWLHEGSGATSAQEATARVLLSEARQ